jgi:AmmeMemoRadiSam system protein A
MRQIYKSHGAKQMKLGMSHSAIRRIVLPCCFALFVLLSAISAVTSTAWASGPEAIPAQRVPAEEGGKERIMADTEALTQGEGRCLLSVARGTIEQRLFERKGQDLPDSEMSPIFTEKRGTFVTLTKDGSLRGCIGHITPQESVLEGIRANAINAAFRDPRFRPLSKKEWPKIKIEISILTDPRPLEYTDSNDLLGKLRPGVDGVIIKKGYHQATFLPQVWEQLPNQSEFLTHLCVKAGMDGDAWKKETLQVSTYQVQAFEEH